MRRPGLLALAALTLLAAGCESYDTPNRPLPEDFEVRLLGGELLGPESLRGRPWVVHLWVPR